ncbi:hypothetical protein STAN_1853 [Streptomyces sp. CBMAI 2042]|nr:hypothetical protein STAN_1853 [Streptomyces sp. CBMAI 2042]
MSCTVLNPTPNSAATERSDAPSRARSSFTAACRATLSFRFWSDIPFSTCPRARARATGSAMSSSASMASNTRRAS